MQLPLSETRSDAHGNMLGALLMAGAGYTLIPEVGGIKVIYLWWYINTTQNIYKKTAYIYSCN